MSENKKEIDTQDVKSSIENALKKLKESKARLSEILEDKDLDKDLGPRALKAIKTTDETLRNVIPQMEEINNILEQIFNFILSPIRSVIKKSSRLTKTFGFVGIFFGFGSIIFSLFIPAIQTEDQHKPKTPVKKEIRVEKVDKEKKPQEKPSLFSKTNPNMAKPGSLKKLVGTYFGGSFDVDNKIRKFKGDILASWKIIEKSKDKISEFNNLANRFEKFVNELNPLDLSKAQIHSVLVIKFNLKLIESILIEDVDFENIVFNINSFKTEAVDKKRKVELNWVEAETLRVNSDYTKALERYEVIRTSNNDHLVLDIKGIQYISAKTLAKNRVDELLSFEIPKKKSIIILFNSVSKSGANRDGAANDGKKILVNKGGFDINNIFVDTSRHTTDVPIAYYRSVKDLKGLKTTLKTLYPRVNFNGIKKYKYPSFGNKQIRDKFEKIKANFAIRMHKRPN